MAMRAMASGTISFGLVSIPVKLFTAASSESISFNMLHAACGGRLKQQLFCPVDNQVVSREDTVRGYEFARDRYVRFTDDEVKAFESERSNYVELIEFVPAGTVDLVHIEKSYYLGPDKGGERAYRLLSDAMGDKERVAVGRWAARGKDQLVLVRPYHDGGLILHQLYYADEVRSFGEVDRGTPRPFTDAERDLAQRLIDQLSVEAFEPGNYHDRYAARVREVIDNKVAGQDVVTAPEAPRAQIIDLFEALKASLSAARAAPGEAPQDGESAPEEAGEEELKPRPIAKAEAPRPRRTKRPAAG